MKYRNKQHLISFKRVKSCLLFVLFSIPFYSHAQAVDVEPVNWAYSSIFGSGWYTVNNNQSLFALNLPVRQTLTESSISDNGKRKIGIDIDYAVSIGFYTIDDLPGLLDPDNFGSLVFTPGVILDIPLTKRWRLRPYANAGYGTKLGSSDSSWIYYAGIKSRYTFPVETNNWALISSIFYGGYTPRVGQSNDLTGVHTGIEYRQQLKSFPREGKAASLYWTLAYSYLNNDLSFDLPAGGSDSLNEQYEVAVAYGYRKHPITFWSMEFDNIGIGYRESSNGTFKGISINLGSWFTRS